MPNRTIYVRNGDLKKWDNIPDKPEWLHSVLNGVTISEKTKFTGFAEAKDIGLSNTTYSDLLVTTTKSGKMLTEKELTKQFNAIPNQPVPMMSPEQAKQFLKDNKNYVPISKSFSARKKK